MSMVIDRAKPIKIPVVASASEADIAHPVEPTPLSTKKIASAVIDAHNAAGKRAAYSPTPKIEYEAAAIQ